PRLVTVIDAPVVDTVSMRSRHLALNSAAEIATGGRGFLRAAFMTMKMTITRTARPYTFDHRPRVCARRDAGQSKTPSEAQRWRRARWRVNGRRRSSERAMLSRLR